MTMYGYDQEGQQADQRRAEPRTIAAPQILSYGHRDGSSVGCLPDNHNYLPLGPPFERSSSNCGWATLYCTKCGQTIEVLGVQALTSEEERSQDYERLRQGLEAAGGSPNSNKP